MKGKSADLGGRRVITNKKITEQVEAAAKPIEEEKGCTLWDVEYVREGSERFLRVYIDKEGGVCIDDCDDVTPVNLDGELRLRKNVDIEVAEEKLRFFHPACVSVSEEECVKIGG